jgi:prophage antirepressor-like protein
MSNVILLEQFKNKPIRIVRRSNEVMVPLNDIADALEYNRAVLHQLVKRNEAVFKHFKGISVIIIPGGSQETLCLSRDGVLDLLMKLDYHRIKDETKKQLIIDFQVWASKHYAKYVFSCSTYNAERSRTKL